MNDLLLKDKHGIARCEIANPAEDLLFQGDGYRIYLASTPNGKETVFLRLPTDRFGNGDMQFEVEKLEFLKKASDEIEVIYQKERKDPKARVHYDWLVPELWDSFITDESQNFRQANLIGIRDAKVRDFFPLPKLTEKYQIDTRSAAWILGRFFKLMTFADEVELGFNFMPDQVVLEPRMHRMVFLGWNLREYSPEWNNVARASKCILEFTLPSETPEDEAFMKNLRFFAESRGLSGAEAHRMLYAVIRKYWGISYHPFTYYNRETATWHSLTDATIPNLMKGGIS